MIKDMETYNNIKQYINDTDITSYVGKGFWIGLKEDSTDGYKWIDGTLLGSCSSPFTGWANGEPNNRFKEKKGEYQDCVQLWKRSDYEWDDDFCSKSKQFICMKKVCPGNEGCTSFVDESSCQT
ncbi:hepatic lectin-like [Glandiceps talaboti]